MSEYVYLRCDFSGIQRYVLGVKRAGPAQAKRLRARSFLLELFEHAALKTIKDRFSIGDEDVLIQGGGGFLVRLSFETDAAMFEQINAELQQKLWTETGGEVQVAIGWGKSDDDSRVDLEQRKRRPGDSILQNGKTWNIARLSLSDLDNRCDICEQALGITQEPEEDDESVLYWHCGSCLKARDLGERLTRWVWMRPTQANGPTRALGVAFEPVSEDTCAKNAFYVGRWIPRSGGEPLTFEEIAAKARGRKAPGSAEGRCR